MGCIMANIQKLETKMTKKKSISKISNKGSKKKPLSKKKQGKNYGY